MKKKFENFGLELTRDMFTAFTTSLVLLILVVFVSIIKVIDLSDPLFWLKIVFGLLLLLVVFKVSFDIYQ